MTDSICHYCNIIINESDYSIDTSRNEVETICLICKNIFKNLKFTPLPSLYKLPENIDTLSIDDHNIIDILSQIQLIDQRNLNFDFLILMSKFKQFNNDFKNNENNIYSSLFFDIPDFSVLINNFSQFYVLKYADMENSKPYNPLLTNYKFVKKKILHYLSFIVYTKLSNFEFNENKEIIDFILSLSTSNPLLYQQFSRVKLYFKYIYDSNQLKIGDFYTLRDVVTLTGRYVKLCNSMSQTKWKVDGFGFTAPAESSIEELSSKVFNKLFGAEECKLIASGREDCDVRMMGKGRLFALEIYKCKTDISRVLRWLKEIGKSKKSGKTCVIINDSLDLFDQTHVQIDITDCKLTNDGTVEVNTIPEPIKIPEWRTLEEIANQNLIKLPKDIKCLCYLSFNNLRFTFEHKNVRRHLQSDSEKKKKQYSCLVISKTDLLPSDMKIIEDTINKKEKGLKISQGNPLRITHRRSQEYREKTIYKITTRLLHPRLFILNMLTEAGTYIKEFVNGDLGRSSPSISEMLGDIDLCVIKLDVIEIN